MAQAELRQGTVPRPVPAGPDRPAGRSPTGARGRRPRSSWPSWTTYVRTRSTARRSSGTPASPTRCSAASAELGAFGMKIDEKYGGLGLSNLRLLPGADAGRLGQPGHRRAAVGAPVDRRAAAAQAVRHRRAEEDVPAPAGRAARCRRSCSPSPTSAPTRRAWRTVGRRRVEGGYRLNGVKLWATNGTVATLLVVMARVPRVEGHRGGITAFVVEGDARGHHGRAAQRVPRPARPGEQRHPVPRRVRAGGERHRRRGPGPQDRADHAEHRPAVAARDVRRRRQVVRSTSPASGRRERVQWGRPVGEHEAVAKKIAFIAATTYGMESMLDLCCLLADDDRNDIRIEAALVKLYASEMAWQVADELIQIRGGRGYETADSLAARGERAIAGRADPARPADQPDLRGLHRDHAPAHRPRGGRRAPRRWPATSSTRTPALGRKARAGARAGGFYARWLPTLAVGRGQVPGGVRRVRPARRAPALRRAGLAQAGPVDVLRDGPLAGQAGAQAGLPRPDRGHRRRAVRDVGGVRAGPRGAA